MECTWLQPGSKDCETEARTSQQDFPRWLAESCSFPDNLQIRSWQKWCKQRLNDIKRSLVGQTQQLYRHAVSTCILVRKSKRSKQSKSKWQQPNWRHDSLRLVNACNANAEQEVRRCSDQNAGLKSHPCFGAGSLASTGQTLTATWWVDGAIRQDFH